MSHAVFLCLQITQIILIRGYLDGYILDDFEAVGFQSHSFYRVIGQQAHFVNTQVAQHLCATTIVALVGFES